VHLLLLQKKQGKETFKSYRSAKPLLNGATAYKVLGVVHLLLLQKKQGKETFKSYRFAM